MKVYYHVYSGTVCSEVEIFVYKFSRTPDITLKVSQKGFSIEVYRTVKKDGTDLLLDPLFRDALKKAAKIQLIKYGAVSKESIYAEVDGNSYCLFDATPENNKVLLYCLCGNSLNRKMLDNWKSISFNRIVSVTKTKTNRLDSALDAFLMSKSKVYETEKFIYLWMTMNGLYGYTAEIARKRMQSKKEQKWLEKEFAQLKFFAMLNGYAYRTPGSDKEVGAKISRELAFLLANIRIEQNEDVILAIKENDSRNPYVRDICKIFDEAGIEPEKMHTYSALLLYLPYKVRCNYFHAEKTVPLICFENEYPIPVLRILNAIIENYIDENLHKWFDSKLMDEEILPRINLLADNCHCNSKGHLQSCIVNDEELA